MDLIVPEGDVTTEKLTEILNCGGISYRIDEDCEIYVTEFSSPYWIVIDKERKLLRFYTYIAAISSDDAELVNAGIGDIETAEISG